MLSWRQRAWLLAFIFRPSKPRPPIQFPRLGWRESLFYDIRQGTNSLNLSSASMDLEVDTAGRSFDFATGQWVT